MGPNGWAWVVEDLEAAMAKTRCPVVLGCKTSVPAELLLLQVYVSGGGKSMCHRDDDCPPFKQVKGEGIMPRLPPYTDWRRTFVLEWSVMYGPQPLRLQVGRMQRRAAG